MQQSTGSLDERAKFCIRGLRTHEHNFTHNKKHAVDYCFCSIIYYYYFYQYYLSQLLQYTPKECVQKSKVCLYVDPLQVLKSIMAIWLYLLCISQHNMLIKSHALSLNQKGEKLVHGITFDVEPSEKSSSNLLRTLCKWTPLWSFSLFF